MILFQYPLPLSSPRSKDRASSFHPVSRSSKSSAARQLRPLRGQSQNNNNQNPSCSRGLFHGSLTILHPHSDLVPMITSPVAQKGYEVLSGSHSYPRAETVPAQALVIQKAQAGNSGVLLNGPLNIPSPCLPQLKVTLFRFPFCRASIFLLPWRARAGWTQSRQVREYFLSSVSHL